MTHWEESKELAQKHDWLLSLVYARDHLEAIIRLGPDGVDKKLEPVLATLNQILREG